MNAVFPARAVSRLVLVVGLVALAGCSWLRSNSDYDNSPEARPLAVPPDLDTPPQDPTLQIPAVAPAAARPAAVTAPAPSAAFVIADAPDSAWRRLGLALQRIDGVTVVDTAQALGAYNVSVDGESFLIRVVAAGDGARIEAVGANGAVVNSGAAGRLLGQLKARLG